VVNFNTHKPDFLTETKYPVAREQRDKVNKLEDLGVECGVLVLFFKHREKTHRLHPILILDNVACLKTSDLRYSALVRPSFSQTSIMNKWIVYRFWGGRRWL